MVNLEKLKKSLIEHEGLKNKPYIDTIGKLTIGVGRNLTDKGVSQSEIDLMLSNDIGEVIQSIQNKPYFVAINGDDVRSRVLIEMAFNMGFKGLEEFQKMLDSVQLNRFDDAAINMLDSKWSKQVGQRAVILSEMMKTGMDKP